MRTNTRWARQFADASNKRDHNTGSLQKFVTRPPGGVPFLKGTPKAEPYSQKYEITKVLATWRDAVLAGPGDQGLDIRIYTPTVRFRQKIVITYEGDDNGIDPTVNLTGNVGQPWAIYAVNRNPETGRETRLQLAYPADPADMATTLLPDAYELDSAAEVLQVVTVVNDGDVDPGAPATCINLVLTVTWEPNTEISPAELAMLYPLCQVTHGMTVPMLKGIP